MASLFSKVLKVRNYHDPGTCAKTNHGALILVKDRENKDAIVICTEEEGVYRWKTTEGLVSNLSIITKFEFTHAFFIR